jgi:hypothetical protein
MPSGFKTCSTSLQSAASMLKPLIVTLGAVVRAGSVAIIATNLAAVVHVQLASAMATAQKPGQQQLSSPDRTSGRRTAHAGRIVGDHARVPLELLPGDVRFMMILYQNIPLGHRPMHAAPHALAAILDAHSTRRSPERIGAGIDRIVQNVMHDIVGRQSPDDAARLPFARFHRQLDAFFSQPDMDLTRALEFGKFREDELQCTLDPLIRVLFDRSRPTFT